MILIAGPCSIESQSQLRSACLNLSTIPELTYIRCGVWKPRSRPGGFEGHGCTALQWIDAMREELPSVRFACEVAQPWHVEQAIAHHMDAVWIGARTTSNPFSISELAEAIKGHQIPVMVKNAPMPDTALWLGAIERFEAAGIKEVSAIHRGFSSYCNGGLRNNPLWEIPIELRRQRPNIPIICDPSHIAGCREKIATLSQTALDLSFDGLMIEVHPSPQKALTDAQQQITPDRLKQLLQTITVRSSNCETPLALQELRTQIDDIDRQLIHLLSQRMNVCKEIAHIKEANNLSILQSGRWEQLLQEKMEIANQIGLDSNFIKEIYQKIHLESVRLQLLQTESHPNSQTEL